MGEAIDTGDGQWLRMAVTSDAPKHVWHAGKGYTDDAFDGFNAHTDDHVWVEARGGGRTPDGGGTITIQSEGQSWIQSSAGPLSFVAGNNVVFGTGTDAKSGFKLGASGGVTIVADSRIEACTVPIASPEDALAAETKAADTAGAWGTWWTSLDTACALGLNAMDRAMASALDGSAVPSGGMNWLMTAMGMCANFAGAGANLYGMIGGAAGANTPPGMTIAGEAGVLIGSKMGVNIWGVPGALLGSAFSTVFAGLSTGAIAGVDFGMSSLGTVDMSSLVIASMTALSRKSGVGVELAARDGAFESKAKTNITLQAGKEASLEAHGTETLTVESTQWVDLVAPKGAVGFRSNGTLAFSAQTGHAMGLPPDGDDPGASMPEAVSVAAPNDVPIVTPPAPGEDKPQIAMTAAGGVKILSGAESSAPILTISADKVEFAVGSDGPKGTIDATQVELKTGDSSIKVSAESVKIDGSEVSFS